MRRLRLYDPSYHCEVTIRALHGEFGFDPNDVDIRERIYGLFAEAAMRHGVAIFIFHFMSNHYHGLYGYTSAAQLVDFLAYLHGNLAKLANQIHKRKGYFWSKPQVLAVARDARSVARRFKYIMGQAVRAEISNHPSQFPGASAVDALLYGTPLVGRKVDRSRQCRDAHRLAAGPKEDAAYETRVEVPLTTPPCWAGLTADELRQLYQGIAAEIAANPEDLSGEEPPSAPQGQVEPERVEAEAEERQDDPQVLGTCLISEIADELTPPEMPIQPLAALPMQVEPSPQPPQPTRQEAARPAKVRVPERKAEDGGVYRHGPVRPKVYEGAKKRGKIPMLLSVDPREVAEFEARYKLAVQAYRAAKRTWRAKSRQHDGALRGAKIALPPWMLLGTTPLFVGCKS